LRMLGQVSEFTKRNDRTCEKPLTAYASHLAKLGGEFRRAVKPIEVTGSEARFWAYCPQRPITLRKRGVHETHRRTGVLRFLRMRRDALVRSG
jgi:hypothetical protein